MGYNHIHLLELRIGMRPGNNICTLVADFRNLPDTVIILHDFT